MIFKILPHDEWLRAKADGVFKGSGIDLQDGYIHLSTAEQVKDTARLHFSGKSDLMIFALSADRQGLNLKWEASRGGKLFPHVYGVIKTDDVLWTHPLPWNGHEHVFPAEAEP